jgi:hypothetical protein
LISIFLTLAISSTRIPKRTAEIRATLLQRDVKDTGFDWGLCILAWILQANIAGDGLYFFTTLAGRTAQRSCVACQRDTRRSLSTTKVIG